MSIQANLVRFIRRFNTIMNAGAPLVDVIVRVFVAEFFFNSGLTKISNWDQTLFLFKHEYSVPILSHQFAACLATAIELVLPVLLVLGLMGRLSALTLFFFNLIAVISYSFLWTKAGHVGFMQHVYYGLFLLILIVHGPGRLAIDRVIKRWADRTYTF